MSYEFELRATPSFRRCSSIGPQRDLILFSQIYTEVKTTRFARADISRVVIYDFSSLPMSVKVVPSLLRRCSRVSGRPATSGLHLDNKLSTYSRSMKEHELHNIASLRSGQAFQLAWRAELRQGKCAHGGLPIGGGESDLQSLILSDLIEATSFSRLYDLQERANAI
jgi:hypothetical protein